MLNGLCAIQFKAALLSRENMFTLPKQVSKYNKKQLKWDVCSWRGVQHFVKLSYKASKPLYHKIFFIWTVATGGAEFWPSATRGGCSL